MEELFRRLFDSVPGHLSVQDRDLRIVAANQRFREEFGDGVGTFCYQTYKGRSDRCPICPVAQTFADGRVHDSLEVVTPRSGKPMQVLVRAAPVLGADSSVQYVIELSTDITEVKQLEERHRMLFDEVPCYVSVQGRDLRVRDINRRFKADFGEGIGEHCYRIYKHRTEPCITCSVAETFADGQTHSSEEVVTALDGRQINVLVTTSPLRNEVGEVEAVMEMSTNITALREAQSQIASLGMMVGSVAHGVKGLLSGLDGGVYLMDTGFAKNQQERVEQGRAMIKRNVDRIRGMVLNLLYYARDRELYRQPVDVGELFSSVESVMTRRAEQVGVKITVGATGAALEADHDALHSVLINLVENAIDACRVDKKTAAHEITLSARQDGDRAILEVADNGVGMDQETKEKAFSLFFSSKGAEGTGLGLYISNKIAKAHGGAITIESAPGQGTRFQVILPSAEPG